MCNTPDIVTTDTAVDASTWLAAAQKSVRSYCGWHIAPNLEQDITLDGDGTKTLLLPSMHVTDVASVLVDGKDLVGEIDWSAKGIVQLRRGVFPDRLGSIKVRLRHGFDVGEVADVSSMILRIAKRAANGPGVIASQSANGSSVSYLTAGGAPISVPLLQIEKDSLNPYKLTWGIS
jgi:hypothetical protein